MELDVDTSCEYPSTWRSNNFIQRISCLKLYKFQSFQQINLSKMFIQEIPIKFINLNQKTNESKELHSKSITSFEFTISCDMTWYHRCPTKLSHQPSICQRQEKNSPHAVFSNKNCPLNSQNSEPASEVPVGAFRNDLPCWERLLGYSLRAPFSRCLWKMVSHCQTARTNLNQPAFALYRKLLVLSTKQSDRLLPDFITSY